MKILMTIIIIICGSLGLIYLYQQHHSPLLVKTTTTIATKSNFNIAAASASAHAGFAASSSSLADHTVKIAQKSVEQVNGLNMPKLISVASSHGLKPRALKSALNAYTWALKNKKIGDNKDILTVVDFSLPSYEKRMWVINLPQNKVLMKLYTTQGAGSGLVYADRFSNQSRTQASSIGLYVTSEEYYGGHGKSMRLNGLQEGINNNARRRSIVIHEAPYATAEYIKANHRAGRSWGCFAVAPANKQQLLNYVKGGSVFFAYAREIEKTAIINKGPISI